MLDHPQSIKDMSTSEQVQDRISSFRAMVARISAATSSTGDSPEDSLVAGHPMLSDEAELFTTEVRKSSSLLDKCGVRVSDLKVNKRGEERRGEEKKVVLWFCLVRNCAQGPGRHCSTVITVGKKMTNHGCEHLSQVHNLVCLATDMMKRTRIPPKIGIYVWSLP